MDALTLDPGGYSGSYKLVGGRPSLDFVNTVSWPDTDRSHDWLTTPANVAAWLRAADLPTPSITESDVEKIREVRGILGEVLRPLAHGGRPTRAACLRFNACLTLAQARRCIDPVALEWSWSPPVQASDALAPVVFDAAALLAAGDHSRLKHCPSCDWIFEDQTRNARRRWCDMADCGSRAKARSYYQRMKGSD